MIAPARHDNFDLLRLLAALMVLWSHQFALLGKPDPMIPVFNSALGLTAFFGISGYLNTLSLLRNPSWWRFLVRRALRIYPALIGAALFCAVVGAVMTTADAASFWPAVPRFVFRNATVLFGIDYKLPGVFESNPLADVLNGSLWTLPIELKFYAYLALAMFAVFYRPLILLVGMLALLIGLLVWFQLVVPTAPSAFTHQFAWAPAEQFAVAFATGSALALLAQMKGFRLAIAALAVLAAIAWLFGSRVAWLPGAALVVICLGRLQGPAWLRPPLDISYGAYLFAFPVQQIVATWGLSFLASLALSLVGTIGIAILSAIWIERPALGWRPSQPATMEPLAAR